MDSNLDAAIVDIRCRDPLDTRGVALLRLMANQKLWLAYLRAMKIESLDDLRTEMLKPIKSV